MTIKKTLCANRGLVEQGALKKTVGSLNDKRGKCNSIKLFPQGMQLKVQPIVTRKMSGGGCRGDVVGWSSASRRRMREFMLTHQPPPGYIVCGVTLTIPGPPLPPERAKELFHAFSHTSEREGDCFVWRLEIQKRGQLHWHLIAGTKHPADFALRWWDAIKAMGPETFDPPYVQKSGNSYTSVTSRMALFGAFERACDVSQKGERGAWLRYMQDHNTKGKQEQIAVNIGRHWGVVGRKKFIESKAELDWAMTDPEKARYLRAHQRLATPSHKHECVFGRRLGDRVTRGFRGTTTWFGNPATMTRILDWATGSSQPASSYSAYFKRTDVTA